MKRTLSVITKKSSLLKSIQEYDRIGQEAFLDKYGYGPSRDYFIKHGGKLYDSKPICGAAHQYESLERKPLVSGQFSGGIDRVIPFLRKFGLPVVDSSGKEVLPSRGVGARLWA